MISYQLWKRYIVSQMERINATNSIYCFNTYTLLPLGNFSLIDQTVDITRHAAHMH